jgi:glycosyltransferase involved in cell wall biosynthesis
MDNIKLSICVSTYNQALCIEECLNSILLQVVDFKYEVVVSDDCSTDGTGEIVDKYSKLFPEIIRNVSSIKNGGPFKNYLNVHQAARGQYVAHMDGDDVALPSKLQVQVDFLDQHETCNVVWHRMIFFDEQCEVEHPLFNVEFVEKEIYANVACLLGPMGPHSSTMYRRKNFDANKFSGKCDDWLMALFYMGDGYAYMINQVLGKYRLLSQSMSAGARANRSNRELSTASQIMAIRFNPSLRREVATRALANFVLDASKLRRYCVLSFKVLLQCGVFPKFWCAPRIYRFYKWSKRPQMVIQQATMIDKSPTHQRPHEG